MPFYYDDNLNTYVRVCFVERYESLGKDEEDEKKEMIKALYGETKFEEWVTDNVLDVLDIKDINIRFAIMNSLDYNEIMKDIHNELELDTCIYCYHINPEEQMKKYSDCACDQWVCNECTEEHNNKCCYYVRPEHRDKEWYLCNKVKQ